MEESRATNAAPAAASASAALSSTHASSSSSSSTSSASAVSSSSPSARPSALRVRHIGRLKSFSSRQRALAQPQPQSTPTPLAKSSARGGTRRRFSSPSSGRHEAAGEPLVASTSPLSHHRLHPDDEETKESAQLSRLEVQQQIQQTRPLERVQCLRLTCTAPPELVLPYLYGDRKSRINAIMVDTACTIDYCPLSPDDEPQSPQSHAFIMNFLIAGESVASLEDATRLLRALIDKVEVHLQKKRRIRSLHAMTGSSTSHSSTGPDTGGFLQQPLDADMQHRSERDEREPFVSRLHPSAPSAALETPVDRYRRSHHAYQQHQQAHYQHVHATTDDFERTRREYVHGGGRLRVDVDDATYYDRWGRPVFRDEPVVTSGADAESDGPNRHAPLRRRWQFVDSESEWRHPSLPLPPVAAPERSRVAVPVRRRYVTTYRHSDAYGEYEFDDDHGSSGGSTGGHRVNPRVLPLYPPDDSRGYAAFEPDDLLAREEEDDAREYVHSSAYAARRGGGRHTGYFREASPPPPRYLEPRPARASATLRGYPSRRYVDDHDGVEWLTDEDEHGVLYRRYPRYTAVPYPRVYVSSASTLRQRSSSYPSPGRHASRPVPPDSPDGGGLPKRRKTSAVSFDGNFQARTDPAPSFVRFALGSPRQDESGKPDPALSRFHRDSVGAVASIEVPLSDESSPAVSPAADTRDASLLYESARHVESADAVAPPVEQPDERSDTDDAMSKRAVGSDEAVPTMERCDADEDRADPVEAADTVVATADDANASDTTDATSHEAIGEELHSSESAASSGLSSTTASDHDHDGDHDGDRDHDDEAPTALVRNDEGAIDSADPPAPVPVQQSSSARLGVNDAFIAALEHANVVERERLAAQRDATAQRRKYLALEARSKALAQLDVLVAAVYDLQCRVVATSCRLDLSVRREMLAVLDSALEALAQPEPRVSVQAKVVLLREGLENALTRCDLATLVASTPDELSVALNDSGGGEQTEATVAPDEPAIGDTVMWAHDDNDTTNWFEDSDGRDDDAEMLHDADDSAAPAAATKRHALEPTEDDATLASSAASSFASTLFVEVASCSPRSFVMKGMQKQLFREIERANAYYYLHPVKPFEANRVRPPPTACDFGCHTSSTTAPAWVQKVIAQITSRMKWFDEVTYSLARARSSSTSTSATATTTATSANPDTGVGADRLNRKKMNSTIRKLHLMAIQLHCVVAHLYCVRRRSACNETDSLHAALNSSFFEKRMIAYKARLKLDGDLHGTPDELLRDTFEFFPEFLLCLEMWGYDYRERRDASGLSTLRVSRQALPLGFFARVETCVFDYDTDRNGFLQTVCEELLSIVCLWNDFVWGDNLQTLAVDRIAAFEAEIKKSTAKILHTYALHLMGAWAVRLLDNPDELRGLRFTQQNAYYADSVNLRGCSSSSGLKARLKPVESTRDTVDDTTTDGKNTTNNNADTDERAVASAYWQQKANAGVRGHTDSTASALLRVDTVEAWSKEAVATHLLPWSRVFELRCELETCGIVTSDLGHAAARTSADASELRRLVEQTRAVGSDAVDMCDVMALHFASFQLPQEPPRRAAARSTREAVVAATSTPVSTGGDIPGAEAEANSTDAVVDSFVHQPDVKDLIQILASTRKEVQEIFCARTRSGRVRDKLQAQSVQLAQQTIDLLQSIAARRSP